MRHDFFEGLRFLNFSVAFFFSSRGRHTRCYRDWSSDVCSSDLDGSVLAGVTQVLVTGGAVPAGAADGDVGAGHPVAGFYPGDVRPGFLDHAGALVAAEIGRASCRERGQARVRTGPRQSGEPGES